MFGVQSGNGALLVGGKIVGYYVTTSIAYGLQAGVLPFGYALFLMTDSALDASTRAAVGRWAGTGCRHHAHGSAPTPTEPWTLRGNHGRDGGTMARRPTSVLTSTPSSLARPI